MLSCAILITECRINEFAPCPFSLNMESIERSLSLVSTFGPTLLVSSCRLRGSGLHSARSFVTSKFMSRLYPVPSLSLTSSSFLSMHLKPNFVQRRALSVIKSRPVSSLLAQSYRIPCEENLSEKDSKLQTKPELKVTPLYILFSSLFTHHVLVLFEIQSQLFQYLNYLGCFLFFGHAVQLVCF